MNYLKIGTLIRYKDTNTVGKIIGYWTGMGESANVTKYITSNNPEYEVIFNADILFPFTYKTISMRRFFAYSKDLEVLSDKEAVAYSI